MAIAWKNPDTCDTKTDCFNQTRGKNMNVESVSSESSEGQLKNILMEAR